MKTCTKCNTEKPVTEFSKSAKGRGGLQAWCKACACIATTEYRATYPGKAKAATTNWKAANTDKRKVYDAKYRANNHAKRKAAKAKWAADNPEAARTYQHNRNAIKRELGGKLSK